ncbi:MAG: biotin/lipoate A/B protein ligase family protein [Chloroflexota bacterium]
MRLRLLDLGGVPGVRSQAVYHALCDSVTEGGPDTLAIMYPTNPYVSVGFHRDLETEIDTGFCASRDLPVYRRRVGGGTVYLDRDQVFFQLIVHERHARMSVERAYGTFLEPAASAYRTLGVAAARMGVNDLAIDGRKLSGTGMASIGDAVVFVGNIICDLDHAAMAGILRLPDATAAAWVEASMRRWVTSIRGELGATPDYATVAAALGAAYEAWAGEPLEPGALSAREIELIEEIEIRLQSKEWLRRDEYERAVGHASPVRRVKIRAGRWDGFFPWAAAARGSGARGSGARGSGAPEPDEPPVRVYVSSDAGVVEAIRFVPDRGLAAVAKDLVGRNPADPGTADRITRRLGATSGQQLAELLAIAARPEG